MRVLDILDHIFDLSDTRLFRLFNVRDAFEGFSVFRLVLIGGVFLGVLGDERFHFGERVRVAAFKGVEPRRDHSGGLASVPRRRRFRDDEGDSPDDNGKGGDGGGDKRGRLSTTLKFLVRKNRDVDALEFYRNLHPRGVGELFGAISRGAEIVDRRRGVAERRFKIRDRFARRLGVLFRAFEIERRANHLVETTALVIRNIARGAVEVRRAVDRETIQHGFDVLRGERRIPMSRKLAQDVEFLLSLRIAVPLPKRGDDLGGNRNASLGVINLDVDRGKIELERRLLIERLEERDEFVVTRGFETPDLTRQNVAFS